MATKAFELVNSWFDSFRLFLVEEAIPQIFADLRQGISDLFDPKNIDKSDDRPPEPAEEHSGDEETEEIVV